MTDNEYDSRLEIIGELAARFPSAELTDQNVKGYVWSLSDLPLDTLRTAIDQCINTCKFFPVVADIRERAEAIKKEYKDDAAANCQRCFGAGVYIEEGRDADGYKYPARRCDPHVFTNEPDVSDVSMF